MQRIEYSQARQGPVGHLTERLWCSWRGHRWDFAYQQAEFARIAETGPGGLFLRAVEIPAVEWTTHRCPRCDLLRAVGVVLADGDGGARPSRSPEEPARRGTAPVAHRSLASLGSRHSHGSSDASGRRSERVSYTAPRNESAASPQGARDPNHGTDPVAP